jgi:hypothetical protein
VSLLARILGHLVLFAVVVVVALVAAFAGAGAAIGRDIGFAGGGIFLLFVPAALIAVAIAYALPMWRRRESAIGGAAVLILLAGGLSFLLGGGPWAASKYYAKQAASEMAPKDETAFAYIPGPDYRAALVLEFPERATVGDTVPIRVKRVVSGWKKVPVEDVRPGTLSFPAPPEPTDVLGPIKWKADFAAFFRIDRFDEATGTGEGTFIASTQFEVRASAQENLVWKSPVWSNSIIVSIYPR